MAGLPLRSKWVDVVGDRDLTQQYLADDMRRLDVVSEDSSLAGTAGRQHLRDFRIFETNPGHERR